MLTAAHVPMLVRPSYHYSAGFPPICGSGWNVNPTRVIGLDRARRDEGYVWDAERSIL